MGRREVIHETDRVEYRTGRIWALCGAVVEHGHLPGGFWFSGTTCERCRAIKRERKRAGRR